MFTEITHLQQKIIFDKYLSKNRGGVKIPKLILFGYFSERVKINIRVSEDINYILVTFRNHFGKAIREN